MPMPEADKALYLKHLKATRDALLQIKKRSWKGGSGLLKELEVVLNTASAILEEFITRSSETEEKL